MRCKADGKAAKNHAVKPCLAAALVSCCLMGQPLADQLPNSNETGLNAGAKREHLDSFKRGDIAPESADDIELANQPVPAAPARQPAPPKAKNLTAQAGDPTAPLVQAQVTYLYSDVIRNGSGSARQFLIEPVIPIPPNRLMPIGQILRPTVPRLQAPNGKSGLGDIDLEHVFVPERHKWGTLGFGYSLTFPTADHRELGTGKYQAGPAMTVVYYGIEDWQIGGTATQTWSVAGKGDRDDVTQFTLQPILNCLLGRWYIGIGDFTWSYDWKNNQGWTIPLGFQIGRITDIGSQKFNLSVEALWVPIYNGDAPGPERGVKFGFVWLLPE